MGLRLTGEAQETKRKKKQKGMSGRRRREDLDEEEAIGSCSSLMQFTLHLTQYLDIFFSIFMRDITFWGSKYHLCWKLLALQTLIFKIFL